jgi:SUMO ligase MMS21 Smc5/6 complex component
MNMVVEDARVIVGAINQDEQKVNGTLDTVESILAGVDEGMDFSVTRLISNATRGKDNRASYDMKYLGLFLNVTTEEAKFNILEEYARVRNLLPVASNMIDLFVNVEEVNPSEIINNI